MFGSTGEPMIGQVRVAVCELALTVRVPPLKGQEVVVGVPEEHEYRSGGIPAASGG